MLKARILTEEDYDEICEWWEGQNFEIVSRDFLPEKGTCGIMVYKDEVNICAQFLYFTNSGICWTAFTTANHLYREKDRGEAIKLAISETINFARAKGAKAIFTAVTSNNLVNHYKNCGYINAGEQSTELIIKL